ncbi:hypothetical protein LEMLEM_LOCUS11420 [Lemmus lemmus]
MKSEDQADTAMPFVDTLGKLALPLTGNHSKKTGPFKLERWPPSLTTGQGQYSEDIQDSQQPEEFRLGSSDDGVSETRGLEPDQ